MTLSRQRKLTPEAFARKSLTRLPPEVRLTEVGLRMYADDQGRGKVSLRLILGHLYPDTSEVTESTLVDHLLKLAEAEAIVLYDDRAGESYFQVLDWPPVDRGKESEHPEPPFARSSRNSREPFVAGERERERDEREARDESEGDGESRGRSRMSREGLPPNPFCSEHPDGGVLFPCIACQNARLANQHYKDRMRWELEQSLTKGPRFE